MYIFIDGDLMIRSKKLLIKFTIILQTLMLLFAAVVVPAAADDSQEALELPIVLSGDIYVNGEKALVGTEIEVKLNGEVLDSTVVKTEGEFGDTIENKILIPSEPEKYNNVELYINGEKIEVDTSMFGNPGSDGFLNLNINAEISESNLKPVVSGGMGGFIEETPQEPEITSQEETGINEIGSEAPIEIKGSATSNAQEKSIPVEEGSNTMLIVAGGLGLLLVAGFLMYKTKKNQKE